MRDFVHPLSVEFLIARVRAHWLLRTQLVLKPVKGVAMSDLTTLLQDGLGFLLRPQVPCGSRRYESKTVDLKACVQPMGPNVPFRNHVHRHILTQVMSWLGGGCHGKKPPTDGLSAP